MFISYDKLLPSVAVTEMCRASNVSCTLSAPTTLEVYSKRRPRVVFESTITSVSPVDASGTSWSAVSSGKCSLVKCNSPGRVTAGRATETERIVNSNVARNEDLIVEISSTGTVSRQ